MQSVFVATATSKAFLVKGFLVIILAAMVRGGRGCKNVGARVLVQNAGLRSFSKFDVSSSQIVKGQ